MGLRFAPAVQDFVRTLPPSTKTALRAALRKLGQDPRHRDLDVKVLRKDGPFRFFRARVSDYRIIYTFHRGDVYVWRIQHRAEGYGWLERLDPERAVRDRAT